MFKIPQKIGLLLGDILSLHLILAITLALRYPGLWPSDIWSEHWPEFIPVFLIWLLIIYINDLYNLNHAGPSPRFWRGLLSVLIIAPLLSALYFYLNFYSPVAPKTNLALFTLIFIISFYGWRRLYQVVSGKLLPPEKIAIIGPPNKGEYLLETLPQYPGSPYRGGLVFEPTIDPDDLIKKIKQERLRTLIVYTDCLAPAQLGLLLKHFWRHDVNIFNYVDFYEDLSGQVPLDDISPSWLLDNIPAGQKKYFHYFKQGWDFWLAGLILIISLPLWPLIALMIKAVSPGPVFFRQERLGRNGQKFQIIKFRTMSVSAKTNDQRGLAGKQTADLPSIIPGGRFLRQTRLDELPQVLNILKGDMSFIGPRPEQPGIAAELSRHLPFYNLRLLVKPGLTGWDQISGIYRSASLADSREKLQHDLYYLKHRSLYLDMSISLKTIATIISRSGQ